MDVDCDANPAAESNLEQSTTTPTSPAVQNKNCVITEWIFAISITDIEFPVFQH